MNEEGVIKRKGQKRKKGGGKKKEEKKRKGGKINKKKKKKKERSKNLAGHGTSKVHSAGLVSLCLNTQHNSGGQLVVSVGSRVLDLNNVNGVPGSLHGLSLLGGVLGLLDEDDSGKAIIQVPGVDGGNTTLVVPE